MPEAPLTDLTIAYETAGDSTGEPLLLVQGLGMPLTAWPDAFIEHFVEAGYFVVTFDNRDIGQSTLMSHLGTPSVPWQLLRMAIGLGANAPYTLDHMAADTIALLDFLKIAEAHVVGVSMGAMIAQILAIRHAERVRSLTSMMSTTARPGLPGASGAVRRQLLSRPDGNTLEARIKHGMKTWRMIGSPDYQTDERERRAFLRRNIERGVPREGITRQLTAIAASEPRHTLLAAVSSPTLVVHGEADPLVPLACGEDTAKCVPDATLHTVPGMGHDLPAPLVPGIVATIIRHMRAAD